MVNRGCWPTSRLTYRSTYRSLYGLVHVMVECWLMYWPSSIILSVEYWLSVDWQINQQLVTIASHICEWLVEYWSCLGQQYWHRLYNILVPKAFSFVTRYLSTGTSWTLVLVTHIGCGWYQIDQLPNNGLFSCTGQHFGCLCVNISVTMSV